MGVEYALNDGIATITMDDGKRNALSPQMFKELNAAFDRAESDNAIVVLTGREEVFSAGFDLKVIKAGGLDAISMLKAGYSITARIMEYPRPVISACNGHVLAMGVFMMLSTDYIIGTKGDFKVSANEVAIGMTMPRAAAEVLRQRLRPADFQRAVVLAEYFSVEDAREAGFFDELVEADQLLPRALSMAEQFKALDANAHYESKKRIRATTVSNINRSIPLDLADAAKRGATEAVKGVVKQARKSLRR